MTILLLPSNTLTFCSFLVIFPDSKMVLNINIFQSYRSWEFQYRGNTFIRFFKFSVFYNQMLYYLSFLQSYISSIKSSIEYQYFLRYCIDVENYSIVTTLLCSFDSLSFTTKHSYFSLLSLIFTASKKVLNIDIFQGIVSMLEIPVS